MRKLVSLTACLGLIALIGCSQEASTESAAPSPPATASVDGSKYLLSAEPEGGAGVIKVREEAKDQDDVVITGRIGGSEDPWIEGLAAFSIVDPSLRSCADIGADGCPKPWDFC